MSSINFDQKTFRLFGLQMDARDFYTFRKGGYFLPITNIWNIISFIFHRRWLVGSSVVCNHAHGASSCGDLILNSNYQLYNSLLLLMPYNDLLLCYASLIGGFGNWFVLYY